MNGFFSKNAAGKFSPAAIAVMVVGGIVVGVAFAFLFGWIVMLLWNWLMPTIFKLPRIGYWQAWGLLVLSHILIKGGFGSGSHSDGDKKKHKNVRDSIGASISQEIREEIRKEMAKECAAEEKASEPTA